ncbi:hypothetical protein D3C72_1943610 [compost metagenome]
MGTRFTGLDAYTGVGRHRHRQVTAERELRALLITRRHQLPLALGGFEDNLVVAGARHRRGGDQADTAVAISRLQQAAHLATEQIGSGVRVAELNDIDRRAVGVLELARQYRQVAIDAVDRGLGRRIGWPGRGIDRRHRATAR